MWVKVLENLYIRCSENQSGKKYKYESKLVNDTGEVIQVIGHDNNSPTQTSTQAQLHRFLKSALASQVAPIELDSKIISIKNELESNIVKLAIVDESKEKEKAIEEKYVDLYTDFQCYLQEYELTPLELIVAVTHCLGVGKPREIVRAFLGYFQTVVGYKGTNVIAIGTPASGKSFILETALDMIPSERIIHGAKSVSYFFNKYTGQDMTGYIFYLGDIGSMSDDAETDLFRNKIKQLSTDGHVERGITDKETMLQLDQIVTGHPSLSYTTALEENVNEQEKTRSVILTPNPIDTAKLMVFNFLMENHGIYHDDIEKMLSVRDSIQGLVYKFNPDEYDFFNPYMFCIEEHLKDHDDFNRKILEFNAILKLVTLLNSPNYAEHTLYMDDEYQPKKTKVYFASKRDNLNALNIFDSANLLPDESRFANGIIKEYSPFKEIVVSDDELYEDAVYEKLNSDGEVNDEGYITIESWNKKKLFTIKSLKSAHRNKRWYRKSRNYVQDRLNKLVDEEVIVNVGKEKGTKYLVYCLNQGMESSVDSALPNFNKELVDKASKVFQMVYPQQYDEFMKFLESDDGLNTTDLFESVKPLIENLPFLEEVFCEL
jgi:hypothetical protein